MENEDNPIYSNLFHCWIVQKVRTEICCHKNDWKYLYEYFFYDTNSKCFSLIVS